MWGRNWGVITTVGVVGVGVITTVGGVGIGKSLLQ